MTRLRLVILAVVAAVLAALVLPVGANASTPSGTSVTQGVSVSIQYEPAAGGSPIPLDPSPPYVTNHVQVLLWVRDVTGHYNPYTNDPSTISWSGTLGSTWSASLPAGTYRAEFVPVNTDIGQLYWDGGSGARYFSTAKDFTVTGNQVTGLGVITLPQHWKVDVTRLSGTTRYGTAAAVSRQAFPGVSGPTDHPSTPPSVVYLASGLAFPDALAAGPAAIHLGGVVLLTDPTTLSPETKVELARLQPKKVIVVGSSAAVSNSVMTAAGVAAGVSAASDTLLRQAGPDRYATADAIVQYAFTTNVYSSTAFIATGRNYPDALAAGPGAGLTGSPVILVDGSASSLSASTLSLLNTLGTLHVGILGSTAVVSPGIESQLDGLYGQQNVGRLARTDRYATAALFNTFVHKTDDYAMVANGLNFPDALTGASLAGATNALMFLSPPTCFGNTAATGVESLHVNGLFLLGGPSALSANVAGLTLCEPGPSPISPAS